MTEVISQRKWWLAFALIVSITALVSVISYAGQMPGIVPQTQLDKVIHFAIGGSLAVTLDGGLRRRNFGLIPAAITIVLVPAGIEEWLQRFSTPRTSSLGDFAADVV